MNGLQELSQVSVDTWYMIGLGVVGYLAVALLAGALLARGEKKKDDKISAAMFGLAWLSVLVVLAAGIPVLIVFVIVAPLALVVKAAAWMSDAGTAEE